MAHGPPTVSVGRLPNLLIVGVPKAGTTSLFGYLAQHPDIFGSEEKELGYFNHFSSLRPAGSGLAPVESYAARFAGWSRERYAMEATPSYSYGGQPVIDGIREQLGTPKIILALRNPTERLWSAYTFQRSLGNIASIGSFEEYLTICEERRASGADRVETSRLQGLAIGFYAEYVPLWLEAFGADARIVFADELAREPHRVLGDLCRWLEIDDGAAAAIDIGARNVTAHARNPRVAQMVYSVKRAADRVELIPRRLRDPLRKAYLRLNAGPVTEVLGESIRQRVDAIYAASNRDTALALQAHGYADLPDWLPLGAQD